MLSLPMNTLISSVIAPFMRKYPLSDTSMLWPESVLSPLTVKYGLFSGFIVNTVTSLSPSRSFLKSFNSFVTFSASAALELSLSS